MPWENERRPVLYQLCRAGERFEVGDGPVDLSDVRDLTLGRGDPGQRRPGDGRLLVDDPWMSSRHAQLFREGPRFVVEDLGSTNGVVVNGQSVKRHALEPGDLVETGRTFWTYQEENRAYALSSEPVEFGTWATWTPMLADQLRELARTAPTKKHILMSGPEGTGKGFLARTVHLMSGRAGRLIHLDCKERRPKRLAVDLFGDGGEPARLEEADGGTLFLENVDGLPGELQRALVDAVASGSFTAQGRRVAIDVRVVASTRLDIEEAIALGSLQPSLVELVSEVTLFLPGLDERPADLGLLIDDFLARARGAQALTREACRAVLRHDWRLQVKALSRVIEAAAVLAKDAGSDGRAGGTIDLVHLPVEVVGPELVKAVAPRVVDDRPPSVQAPLLPERAPSARMHPPIRPDEGSERTSNTEDMVFTDEATDAARAAASRGELDELLGLEVTDPSIRHTGGNRQRLPAWQSQSAPSDDQSSPWADAPRSRPTTSADHARVLPDRAPSAQHDLDQVERSYAAAVDPDLIVEALKKARGNVSAAARYLGKPRALVLRWMREFQINAERYRDR